MKLLALILGCLMALGYCQAALRLRDANRPVTRSRPIDYVPKKVFEQRFAAEGSAPWQVSVQNALGNHICGGAIIGDDVVLTTGNCVAALDKRDVRVVTGTNNWTKPGAIYEAADIIVHCNFDKPMYHNDVALIKLKVPITYNAKTQKIALAEVDELEDDDVLTITGWGSSKLGKPFSKVLKKSEFKYIDNEECIEILGSLGDDVDHGHLCAQPENGVGACHGDAGAPLVDAQGQLVGIGNWGVSCKPGNPVVFARVPFYSDWIRASLKGCSLR